MSATAASTGVTSPTSRPSISTFAPPGSVTSFTVLAVAGSTGAGGFSMGPAGFVDVVVPDDGAAGRCSKTMPPSAAATATAATAIHVANGARPAAGAGNAAREIDAAAAGSWGGAAGR